MYKGVNILQNTNHNRQSLVGKNINNLTEILCPAIDSLVQSKTYSADLGLRDAANLLGKTASLNMDYFWNRSSHSFEQGPVDVIDMFSGCGGMSAGFKALNAIFPFYKLTAAVDIDKVSNDTFKANLQLEPASMDISKVARSLKLLHKVCENLRPGAPLVLIGCAPCQGFSSHRNKAGETDARNSLFGDFSKIAAKLQPDAILIENVPELLTNRYWPFVKEVRAQLEKIGYYVHLTVHNMAEFGLPQERFRALMLAMPKPFLPPKGFLSRDEFRTVRNAIGNLPHVRAGVRNSNDKLHYSAGHKRSTIDTIKAVPIDGGNRPFHIGPDCLRRAAKKNGRAVYEDVYGRLFWDRPAITITAYARNPASGRFVHPEQNRGLTIREAALLQGFPVDYWFSGSLDHCFRQIGNAVPPSFSAFLAAHLLGEIFAKPINKKKFDRGITSPVGASFSRLIPALKAGHRNDVLTSAACSNKNSTQKKFCRSTVK